MPKALLLFVILLAGCAEMSSKDIGRGAAVEKGPVAKVWPKDGPATIAPHGLWRGWDPGEQKIWEVRYTRGKPSGPYRQWNRAGEMIATWPYNWEGQISGWARWFENGVEVYKKEISPEEQPGFDPIGRGAELRAWAETLP